MRLGLHVIDQPVVFHVNFGVFSEVLSVIDYSFKVLEVLFLEEEIVTGDYFAFAIVEPFDFPSLLFLDVVNDSALFPLKVALEVLPLAVTNHKIFFEFVLLNKVLWLLVVNHVVLNGKEIGLGLGGEEFILLPFICISLNLDKLSVILVFRLRLKLKPILSFFRGQSD